jgi:hypothetical protein
MMAGFEWAQEQFSYILGLFAEIGGARLAPFLLAALILGWFAAGKVRGATLGALLLIDVLLLFAFMNFFVVDYQVAAGSHEPIVIGWDYTTPARMILDQNQHLLELSRELRAHELLAKFKGDPDLVWEGVGLSGARFAGGLLMAVFVFCVVSAFGLVKGTEQPEA